MSRLRVLVACEFSGVVRRAFRAKGCDAWSCDLLSAEDFSNYHLQEDACRVISRKWDLLIAFPPCTHLSVSGARWFKDKREEQKEAISFFLTLAESSIPKIAIENPIGIMSTVYRKPDQIIQPWQFGHGETKATCLWLKGLPLLRPTKIVEGREPRVHHASPGPNRWKERSRTLPGIAQAMAEQWSARNPNEQSLRLFDLTLKGEVVPVKDASRYPKDWKRISLAIRERSGGRCECEGECGLHPDHRCVERNGTFAKWAKGKIVLTVAHLNHTPEDCRDENLKAMCQRCHLRYDQELHQRNARTTRRSRKAIAELFK